MSELRTNRIVPRDGLPSGATAGGIVQIVQGTDNREQINWNNGNETTLMTATITPQLSSNKILIIVACAGAGAAASTSWRMRLYRTISGSRTDLPAIADYVNLQGNNGDTHYPCTAQTDSPATTSAVTYTVSGTRRSGSGTMYFNHQGGTADEAESNIVLMEISA